MNWEMITVHIKEHVVNVVVNAPGVDSELSKQIAAIEKERIHIVDRPFAEISLNFEKRKIKFVIDHGYGVALYYKDSTFVKEFYFNRRRVLDTEYVTDQDGWHRKC